MTDTWREPNHEDIENALMSGWPLIHWSRRNLEGDRFSALCKDIDNYHPGQAVVLRDVHTAERGFGTVIALDFENSRATVIPAIR